MTTSEPNQALRPATAVSTGIIAFRRTAYSSLSALSVVGLIIIGVGVSGPA